MKSYNELYEDALMKFKDVYQYCECKHDVEYEIVEIIKEVMPVTV